ncbi:MAG TPA: ornithine cyclodeaminase family protein [Candidatus Polarisedimenticolaceae bacterium]|nr:ornithine cyclodeaminase family protein [Candidatus Polarisedimenticolaceae bacterium]
MSTLIIPQDLVPELLPMGDCVDAMAEALGALARGDAVLPLRTMVWMPDKSGLLGTMPGYLGAPKSLGIKVIAYLPGNHGTDRDSHQGAVLLFDTENGDLLAVIDASSITAIRTAAASGLATRLLAREDAGDLAILGSGVQASAHLDAMKTVRKLRRVRVFSRSIEQARNFARHHEKELGLAIEAAGSAEEAARGADLICTATASPEPVLLGDWIAEGAHINAVGACFPKARELDTRAVVKARLFVDRRESALAEAGDFLIPKAEGAIGDDHILGEIGEIAIGRLPGRRSPREITLFKSLGIAVEDLAAAHRIHDRARKLGKGLEVEFGGRRVAYE